MNQATLTGKVALVTGSARRIGATIVRQLHAVGANVVIHYYSSETDARALQRELNRERENSCFLVQGDLKNISALPELVQEIIDQAGRLDILVNNASSFYATELGKITEQDWDALVGVNMKAPLFLAQACQGQLVQNQGCIVNMVDIHAERPLTGYPLYSMAKAGMAMLNSTLAKELGPKVRVNGIAPGAILWPEQGMDEDQQQDLLAKTALKRSGEPEDIARAVLYLVRDAGYVTGQIIAVDGGRMLNQ